MDIISLIAPISENRIQMIAKEAGAHIYEYVREMVDGIAEKFIEITKRN